MEKTTSKRSKRSPSFTPEEMAVLVDEVGQHHDDLFGGTKGKKNIVLKNQIWQAIAQKMSPSSPCGLRDWGAVRKKWQEFQSQTKKKGAKVRRETMGTGGGAPCATTLTPDEEKVLSIIGKTASEGIGGGIDLLGDEGLSGNSEGEEEEDEEPSGSRAATCTSPGEDHPPQPSPVPARQPAGPGVRMRGGLRWRPPITTCTCSETLVRLEREKLVVLRGIEGQLERQTALQEEMVQIKRQRLELHQRQLALAEAQFNRPSISVPIILPQVGGDADAQ
ncbi:myb-related transcription factor, partner of profilin-like [Osmerus mordax]|uniref:myb-related transcription factor, partner of profilin-like n=1 Tax=Osmerus mordax TaxID=8014 RepID=UPI0035100D38